MAKRISVFLTIICVLLGGILVQKYLTQDRNAPVISFAESEQSYRPGMTEEDLLDGVKATDAEDGDVSRSLRIESVTDLNNGKVSVIYVAKDSANNVTKRQSLLTEAASRAAGRDRDTEVSASGVRTAAERATAEAEMATEAVSSAVETEQAEQTAVDEFANEAYEEIEE